MSNNPIIEEKIASERQILRWWRARRNELEEQLSIAKQAIIGCQSELERLSS